MISFAVASFIQVALVGDFKISEVAKWLGPRYAVTRYKNLEDAGRSESRIVVVNGVPKSERWATERDQFVPRFEHDLKLLEARRPQSRVFVVLPNQASKGFSDEVFGTEVVPLLRQASDEAGIETIVLKDADSAAEDISDAVVDFAAQKSSWRLVSADSEEADEGPAINAIDGKLDTYWHTRYSPKADPYPHQITVDMGTQTSVAGFRYVPRQDGGTNGRVKKYEFFLSLDGTAWGEPAASGILPNTPKPVAIHFTSPRTGRYFKFVALSEQSGGPWATAAELDVLPAP